MRARHSRMAIVAVMAMAMLGATLASSSSGAETSGTSGADQTAAADAVAPDPADTLHRGAPANPEALPFVQPDGSAVILIPRGDGARPWHQTPSGEAVVRGDDGGWYYATGTDADGQLVAGTQLAGTGSAPRSARDLRPTADDPDAVSARAAGDRAIPRDANHQNQGNAKTLVILAQFNNRAGTTTPASWANLYFGASSSVRHFYDTASYGSLKVQPAAETSGTANDGIVGWVGLGYNHPDITNQEPSQGIVSDAIMAANSTVNFGNYDTDGDGWIAPEELHVTVIMAGYETSFDGVGNCGPSVWGHQNLGAIANVDGVFAGASYTTFGERHCAGLDDHPATMGIMVHEMGHDLNLPDLYDVDLSSGGVGVWSIMSYGSWGDTGGHAGSVPSGMDAFNKSLNGWINPTAVNGTLNNTLIEPAQSADDVYRLRPNPGGVDWGWYNGSGSGEYFLVEYRRQIGYDAGLPNCGLLVWHIDEGVISDNSTNAPDNHRLVDVEEADGNEDFNDSDAGDPWPGSTGDMNFGPATSPNSNLYSGAGSGVSMHVDTVGCAAGGIVTDFITPTCPPGPFDDVSGTHAFCTDIAWLATGGVTGGFPDGTFRPGSDITRQAIAAFLYRYSGEPAFVPPAPSFSDVPPSHPFFKEIEWLADTGVADGFPDGTFRPGGKITRQAAAAFFYRLAGEPAFTPPGTASFNDVPPSHPFFLEIEWMAANGIADGFPDGGFRPGGSVTRQAFAAFLHRYDEL